MYNKSSSDSVMKQIAAKLNAVPGSRVKNITYCYDRVKLGRSVCIDVINQFTYSTCMHRNLVESLCSIELNQILSVYQVIKSFNPSTSIFGV